jgi:hypothetical protein
LPGKYRPTILRVLDAAINGKKHFLALASNENLNNALYIILFEVKVFLAERLPTGELQ